MNTATHTSPALRAEVVSTTQNFDRTMHFVGKSVGDLIAAYETAGWTVTLRDSMQNVWGDGHELWLQIQLPSMICPLDVKFGTWDGTPRNYHTR